MNSPGAAGDDAAGAENPPNDGAMLFPLVRLLRPLKPPPLPNPEKAVGAEPPLAVVLRENPLKPLKDPLPSA